VPDPTRRAVLLGAIATSATVVVGCSNSDQQPEAIEIEPTAPPEPDPNVLDELALIGAYTGAINAFPELRGTLGVIADQHRGHARELGATEAELAAITPIPPSATNIRPAVTELIKRERSAANLRADSTAAAQDPEAVRALTFIAASEASHVPELQDVRRALKDGS